MGFNSGFKGLISRVGGGDGNTEIRKENDE